MADELGAATLELNVDLGPLREGLREARRLVENAGLQAGVGGGGRSGGRVQGGARESVNALERAQNSRFRLSQRINELEQRGVDVDRLRVQLGRATTAIAERQFGRFNRLANTLSRNVTLAASRLRVEQGITQEITRQARVGGARESLRGRVGLSGSPADLAFLARQGGPASPIRGLPSIPGSPAALQAEQRLATARRATTSATRNAVAAERQRRTAAIRGQVSNALTSSIIGGAFPLLFGQGAGASLGGLSGGLLGSALGPGGGFAGSLFGTVIGQTADQFNQLAVALQNPLNALPQLIESANLSGPGVEKLAETLAGLGRTAEAEAVILDDLSRTIDPVVLASASAAQDQYTRNVADLQERLGAFLVGPANSFVNWLIEVSERVLNLPEQGVQPSTRGALVGRGLGAATGIAGVGLAGLGVATSFINPFVGVPLTLGGIGLSALGSSQIAGAENQEEQVANAKALEAIFSSINDIQAKRIGIQRQLIDLSSNEKGNADEIRELTRDAALAEIEVQKQRARARAQAQPGILSLDQVRAFRQELEALDLQAEQIQKTFEQATRAAAPSNVIAEAIDRQVEGAEAGFRGLILSAAIAAGAVADSFSNTQSSLNLLEQGRTTLDVNSEAFIDASVDIAVVQDQLDQLDGRKAQVEVEVLSTGLETGLLENSFQNFQRLAQELRTVAENARIGTPEFDRAVTRYQQANDQLRIVSGIIDGTFKNAADAIRQAGQRVRETLEGGFQFLNNAERRRLAEQAFREIDFNRIDFRRAGISGDPRVNQTVRIQDPERVIQAAQFQRRLDQATSEYSRTVNAANAIQERLVSSNQSLNSTILALVQKDWNVYVTTTSAAPAPALG